MGEDVIKQEAANLKALFKGIKNRSQFARDHEVPGGSSMIYQHINGIRPMTLQVALIYAKGLGVPLSEISLRLAAEAARTAKEIGSREVIGVSQEDMPEGFALVDRFNIQALATNERVPYEGLVEKGEPLAFQKNWLNSRGYKAQDLKALFVSGDSMEPTLYDGDSILVNTKMTEPKDGKVFVVNFEGAVLVKRISRNDGKWWITSDNANKSRYPDKLFTEGSFLIGEVVHRQSEYI